MKYIGDLLYWVVERENMRLRKEAGHPPPWTDDPILANNRWCNVQREHDRVTRWIFEHYLPSNTGASSVPFALCVARLVNWPGTLKELGYPHDGWTPAYKLHWMETFANFRAGGIKAWTGAYMVTGGYSAGGEGKEVIIARVLEGAWWRCQLLLAHPSSLRIAADHLSTPGMGPFLVAQVIADLKNTEWLCEASDFWTWCAPGPGSQVGLNFLHEKPRLHQWSGEGFMEGVNEVRELLRKELGVVLCAQNTQNCLCEFHKYVRAKHFGERLKNTYTPRLNRA